MVYDPVGLIRDSLKCIAWKGRAVVVGFAGGEIEKVRLVFTHDCSTHSTRNYLAAIEPSSAQEYIHSWLALGSIRYIR